jgi:hypothetical protein
MLESFDDLACVIKLGKYSAAADKNVGAASEINAGALSIAKNNHTLGTLN